MGKIRDIIAKTKRPKLLGGDIRQVFSFTYRAHENLRQRYPWYDRWHQYRHAPILHYTFLIIFTIAISFVVAGRMATKESKAATCTWQGDTNPASWNDSTHWSCGNVPTSSDIASFTSGSNGATIDTNVDVAGITISGYTGVITQNSGFTVTVGSSNYSQSSGTFTGGDSAITFNGTFTLNNAAGTFTATSSTTTFTRAYTHSAGTFNHNGGTVVYGGSTAYTVDVNANETYQNLQFNSTNASTISLGASDNLIALGTLTMVNGKTNVGTINPRGAVDIQNTFDGGSTVLTIDANATADITIPNGATAPGFNISNAARTVGFAAGATSGVGGAFTMTNGAFNCSDTQTTFYSAFTHTVAAGTFTCTSGTAVFAGSANYTIDVNSSETFNALTFNPASAITFTIASGDTLIANSTVTLTKGTINTGTISAKAGVTVNGLSGGSGTVTLSNTTADQTLTWSSGTLCGLKIDKTGYAATISGNLSAGALTVTAGTLNAGATTNTFSGAVTINGGTFNATTGTMSVAGNWSLSSGTFTHNNGTVAFNASSGTQTVNSGGQNFYAVNHNAAGIAQLVTNNFTAANNLNNSSGTLDLNSKNLTVSGTFTNSTTIKLTGDETVSTPTLNTNSIVTYSATSGSRAIKSWTYTNATLNISGSGGTFSLPAALSCVALNITAGTLQQGANTIAISSTTTALTVSGGTFTGGSEAITDSGHFIFSGGSFTSTSNNFLVAGSWFNTGGTFSHNNGTVTFTSTAVGRIITTNGSSWNNLVFNGSGGSWSYTDAMTLAGSLTLTAGTLNGAKNITISGGGATGDGTLNLLGGTFLLDGDGNFGGDTDWNFENLTFGNGSGAEATTATGTGKINVGGVLTIAANQTLNAGSKTWVLSNFGTSMAISGTFNAQTSLFKNTSGWFRKSHTITGATGAGTNYQIPITVHYGSGSDSGQDVYLAGKCRTDFGDIRFVSSDGTTKLNYWIESKTDSDNAIFWVKVLDDLGSDRTIYIYYGNQTLSSISDGLDTFIWFDDFNRADNADIISEYHYQKIQGGTWSIDTNRLKNTGASGDPNKLLFYTLGTVNYAVSMRTKIYVSTFAGGDASRMGLSCCMASDGGGYCSLLHRSTNRLDFLNDLRSWGSSFSPTWSTGNWYNLEFAVVDPSTKNGQTRLWTPGSAIPSWSTGNFGSGSARTWGYIGFGGSRTSDTTYFDDVFVRKIVATEPTNGSWGIEDNVASYVAPTTYNNLELLPAANSTTITLATAGSQTINVGGYLTIGDGTHTGTINATTNDPIVNVTGNFTIAASGTFIASDSAVFTAAGSWSNSGTFTHSNGSVTLNGSSGQNVTSGGSAFYNLIVTNASASGVTFTNGCTVSGTFTDTTASSKLTFHAASTYAFANININGQAVGTRIVMVSSSPTNQWLLNVTQANPTASYVDVTDSDASGGNAITPISCHDGGNNLNWLFNTPPVNDSLIFTNPYSGTANTAVSDDTTEWNFEAKATDADGPTDINYIEIRFANSDDNLLPYDSLKFRYTRNTNSFSKEADTQNAATIAVDSSASSAGNQWTVNYKIKFNSNFSSMDTNYNIELYTIDNAAAYADTDYSNKYQVADLSLTFSVDSNTLVFASLLPGDVRTGTTITEVSTNYPNGYALAVKDDVAGNDSALLHTDLVTRIADYSGTIDTPTPWSGTGLGICVYLATDKESKWGTGTTETDSNNKYAGIPQNTTAIHAKTGAPTSSDQSKVGHKLVVPSTQKTGAYSGTITYTATGALN